MMLGNRFFFHLKLIFWTGNRFSMKHECVAEEPFELSHQNSRFGRVSLGKTRLEFKYMKATINATTQGPHESVASAHVWMLFSSFVYLYIYCCVFAYSIYTSASSLIIQRSPSPSITPTNNKHSGPQVNSTISRPIPHMG